MPSQGFESLDGHMSLRLWVMAKLMCPEMPYSAFYWRTCKLFHRHRDKLMCTKSVSDGWTLKTWTNLNLLLERDR